MKHYTHFHNKEDWKLKKKKIDTFFLTTKCSPSCSSGMLALKGTGNICTPHQHSLSTRFLRSSHVSHGPLLTGTSQSQEEEGPSKQVMENRNMT